MNEPETIARILAMKRIAIVGLSDKQDRPSFLVASYLSGQGYEIVPVNPMISEWMGRKSYPRLEDIPFPVEVVGIFRKGEEALPAVKSAIAIGAKAVWMQEGVVNEEAAGVARKAGLLVVMDRCLMKEHKKRKA
ncbi:MAG: CoA-binding protein [Candidatus Micrarchaeota archaeon]|nr:CoA-binding protein [Candidatus Micrarchaeota archaeon]